MDLGHISFRRDDDSRTQPVVSNSAAQDEGDAVARAPSLAVETRHAFVSKKAGSGLRVGGAVGVAVDYWRLAIAGVQVI